MAILHTVNKSPFETSTLKSCLEHVNEGDSILLIEDGVYGALANSAISEMVKEKMNNISIYALAPDLAARGIEVENLIDNIKATDYAGFVDLVAKNDVSQAWL